MARVLKFKVEYVNDTPFHANERIGNLTGYSTTYRKSDGFIMVPMEEGKTAHTPKPMEIAIPIHETGHGAVSLPADAAVFIGAQAEKTNFEGRPDCADMFGAARVSVSEIKEAIATSGKFSTTRAMLQNQIQLETDSGQIVPYPRGDVKITLLNPDAVKNVTLLAAARYSCIGSNVTKITKTVDALANKAMEPAMKPIGDQAERINLPYLNDNEVLPGFMVNYDSTERGVYDEGYYLNLANMALRAKGMDEKTFMRLAEKQFKNPTVDDPDFNLVCSIVAAAASMRSVHSVYRSDEAYIQESNTAPPKKIGTESMGVSENQGKSGDCEDLGFTNVRHGRAISHGRKEHASSKSYWTRGGGWESPLLQTMQRVASHFVFTIALTSVASTPKVEAAAKNEMPIMGSKDDDYEIGAHMYGLMIPETTFATLVNRQCKGEIKLDSAKPALAPSVHILEGTGNVDSLYLPLGALYSDPEVAKKRTLYHEQMLTASKIVMREDSLFTVATLEIKPPVTVDKQERRNTNFYRTITHLFTQDPHEKWGVNAFKFDAVTIAEKQPLAGFDLRNLAVAAKANLKSFEKDRARWESIGLLPVGRFSKDELSMLDNLARGTPPARGGFLEPAAAASIFEWQWPNAPISTGSSTTPTTRQIVDDFQKCADVITKVRAQDVTKARVQFAWKCNDFFVGAIERKGADPLSLRAGLLQEITENKRILAVAVRFEPIHATAREHPKFWHYTTVMDVDVALDGPLPAAMKIACPEGKKDKKSKKEKKSKNEKKEKKGHEHSKSSVMKYTSYRAHFKRAAAPLIAAHQPARARGVLIGNAKPKYAPVDVSFNPFGGPVEAYVKMMLDKLKGKEKAKLFSYKSITLELREPIEMATKDLLLVKRSQSEKRDMILKLGSMLIFMLELVAQETNRDDSLYLITWAKEIEIGKTSRFRIDASPFQKAKYFFGLDKAKRVVNHFIDEALVYTRKKTVVTETDVSFDSREEAVKIYNNLKKINDTYIVRTTDTSMMQDTVYIFGLILVAMLGKIFEHVDDYGAYLDVKGMLLERIGKLEPKK